jgi:hypothetical protein
LSTIPEDEHLIVAIPFVVSASSAAERVTVLKLSQSEVVNVRLEPTDTVMSPSPETLETVTVLPVVG